MTGLTVSEWRKYGKHRLYVNGPGGTRVGWYDVTTGEQHLDVPDLADAFTSALAAHQGVVPTPTAQPALPSATPTAAASSDDLSLRRPGQGIREVADVEWTEAKDRSRIGAWFGRLTDAKTDERAYRVGADGEETVGKRLEKLKDRGWFVLHSVPVGQGNSDIDHVLIGPGGVFTINTKNHPGGRVWVSPKSIYVNGRSVPYLHKSRSEAQRAEILLSDAVGFPVQVRATLVILTGTLVPNITYKGQPDDVIVLDRMDVPGAFKKATERLSPEMARVIHEAACDGEMWRRRHRPR